jgi:hypothetical protein
MNGRFWDSRSDSFPLIFGFIIVALVVKKGVCTYAEKAEYASRYINPLGQ